MITKHEKQRLEEMLETEGWKILEGYLAREMQNIIKRSLSIGQNKAEFTIKDIELVRLSEIQKFKNNPIGLINTYSENKQVDIEELNNDLLNIDYEELSQLLQ